MSVVVVRVDILYDVIVVSTADVLSYGVAMVVANTAEVM
jgi:hypothetical protein